MLLATSYVSMPQLVIWCIYVHSLTHSQLLELLTQIICVFFSVMILLMRQQRAIEQQAAEL